MTAEIVKPNAGRHLSDEQFTTPQDFGFREAKEFKSPEQFDFHVQHLSNVAPTTGRLDLSTPLYSRQSQMNPQTVEQYRARRKGVDRSPVQIEINNGEHTALNGHHRIAGAKLRGQKSMNNVEFYDMDRYYGR